MFIRVFMLEPVAVISMTGISADIIIPPSDRNKKRPYEFALHTDVMFYQKMADKLYLEPERSSGLVCSTTKP